MKRDILDDSDVPEDSLSRVFVDTLQTRAALDGLERLLRVRRTDDHAWGAALVGPPRCGKTTLIKEFLRGRREAGRPVRHLYVKLTSDTKPRTIAYHTLEWLRDPNPSYGDKDQRTTRVTDQINRRGYELVIFDEAHYLVDGTTKRVQENGVNWFVGLLDAVRCPVVLVGYELFDIVLSRYPALSGRCLPLPRLRPFQHGIQDDLYQLSLVLDALDRNLGFPELSNLGSPRMAARISVACLGRLGLVEAFLTHAREIAREARHACVTEEDLRRATDDVAGSWARLRFNPFAVEDLDAAVRTHGAARERAEPRVGERGNGEEA